MNQTATPVLEPAPLSTAAAAEADGYSYLLILRFAVTNLIGFALLGAAWMHGLIARVIEADSSYLCVGMFALFLIGLAICGWRINQTSRELNEVRSQSPDRASRAAGYLQAIRGRSGESRSLLASSLKMKLTARLGAVRQIAGALVLIGLIGTVLGFIIVLAGVEPDSAADVSAVGPMVSTLVEGMGVALYTTLVGSILNIWLMANCQILAGGLVKLITGVVELGEQHARA